MYRLLYLSLGPVFLVQESLDLSLGNLLLNLTVHKPSPSCADSTEATHLHPYATFSLRLSSNLHSAQLSLIHEQQRKKKKKIIKRTNPIVYVLIVLLMLHGELPHTINSKAIFALILTEGYFGG